MPKNEVSDKVVAEHACKEAYAIVIDGRKLTRAEHLSLQEFLRMQVSIINGYTPYEAYIDTNYSDDIIPDEE